MKFKPRNPMSVLQTELELDRLRQENKLLRGQIKEQKRKRSFLENLYYDLLDKLKEISDV